MKYLVLGQFDRERMDALGEGERGDLLAQCGPPLAEFYATGDVFLDVGLDPAFVRLAPAGGEPAVRGEPELDPRALPGSVSIIEAPGAEEALRVAALHPAARVPGGEGLGWKLHVLPIRDYRGPEGPADEDAGRVVARLAGEYAEAALRKEPERLAAIYADDVLAFDMWGRHSVAGKAAWLAEIRGWLGGLGGERVKVDFQDLRAELSGDAGFATALVRYAALDPAGAELRSMVNRLTWGLRRRQGAWFVAHQHTSAPLDAEARAIFAPTA